MSYDADVKATVKAMAREGHRNAEIAAVTGVNERSIARWRKGWVLPSPAWSNRQEFECGTYSAYAQGCRCEVCREANRIHHARERRERYASVQAGGLPSHIPHGASAFRNWGCRCEICAGAMSAENAVRYAKRSR